MRSYHFLDVKDFSIIENLEAEEEISTEQQISLSGRVDDPISSIKLIKRDYYKGFDKLNIHHEKVKKKKGRAYGEDAVFNSFIENNDMSAYYNDDLKLLLIEGNKGSVNDFIKKFEKIFTPGFRVERSSVDFPFLIQQTQNVWGGWLNGFNDGNLKSVALYGDHVNLSEDYDRFKAAGKLSSLNCSIAFAKNTYDFMITANRTVVIMQSFTQEQDIDLLLFLKPMLYKETLQTN